MLSTPSRVAVVSQLIVRNLGKDVKAGLKRRAQRHGRSMEAEAREILEAAIARDAEPRQRLGQLMASKFKGLGLKVDIPEIKGQEARPARFRS
jgi:plasmid stability protein